MKPEFERAFQIDTLSLGRFLALMLLGIAIGVAAVFATI